MPSHSENVKAKRAEREKRIQALASYREPLTSNERAILNTDVEEAVAKVHAGEYSPKGILKAYGKRALEAQALHNPLTEICIEDAEREWATKTSGPLAGIPVSLKDTVGVKGYDATVGMSKFVGHPHEEDAAIVRILKDAGAYPYVKTNIPLTLLSFESYNDMWGVTENPHVHGYAPGGSSGGESSLIAFGGSRIGVGTDVAGSVRVPAHFSGIYSLRTTTGRFPKAGGQTTMPGQEGVPAVTSPMARSLKDLSFFLKVVIGMKPWDYDYSVEERPWKEPALPEKLRFGVIWSDGIVDPSPACHRALKLTVDALRAKGHEIVNFEVPDALEGLSVGAQLLCSDGIELATRGMYWGEHNDAGVGRARLWARLPRFIKHIWAFIVEKWYGDKVWAELVRNFGKKSITERWDLVYRREAFRRKFFEAYLDSKVDFLLSVPNATPALPHKGLYHSFSSCFYTFLFNIVDYPAGIIPVTKVDRTTDALPHDFSLKSLNGVAKGAYVNYDADKMHGLPVGVQVVGRRYREEDVLAAMQVTENALEDRGIVYTQIQI